MAVDRRQLVLALAAVIVLGLAAWTLWPASAPPTPQTQAQARNRTGRASPAASEQGPVGAVKLEALTTSRNGPGDAQRNPFRFRPKFVAPPPPLPGPSAIDTQPRPVITGPPPPPPPQPIPLKFVGVLERANGVKWAVLTDGKSPTPLYGRDGDIIDGRYLIVKIGTESIEMTHTNGQGRQVIRLTGQ
jgi:hypothetical protein